MNKPFFFFIAALLVSMFYNAWSMVAAQDGSSLLETFGQPPDAARSSAFWGWIDGNVTREGITADLESMREVGMSGAIQFTLGMNIAAGPVQCASTGYFDLVAHTLREAARLNLEIGFHNGPGFSSSGGPWVMPEDAMKTLVWTEIHIKGGEPLHVSLKQPCPGRSYYRDIAVLAVPESGAESDLLISREFTLTSDNKTLSREPLCDGDWRQGVVFHDGVALLEFTGPVRATSLGMAIPERVTMQATIEVSLDGVSFHEAGSITIDSEVGPQVFSSSGAETFPPATGRFWRISLQPAQDIRVSWLSLRGRPMATGFDVFTAVRASKSDLPDLTENRLLYADMYPCVSDVMNLSALMDKDGVLDWDAPPGEWTILRIGYAIQERTNRPATASGFGLEVDKLNRDAVVRFFDAYPGKWADLAAQTPGLKPLVMFIDSYEVGSQNWSTVVPETFFADHAYDITPWLVAHTGRIIGSPLHTQRYYRDLRYTLVRMFADHYYGELRRLANRRGMRLATQPSGGIKGSFSRFENGYAVDEVHVEFWTRPGHDQHPGGGGGAFITRTAGHTQVVGAEAFTSEPGDDGWRQHPRSLKKYADLAFAGGVNRMVYHASAHQPYPGVQMSYGRWGVNFHRNNTWWPLSRPFHDYLARCGALLQAGMSKSEVLILQDETEPGSQSIGQKGSLGDYSADHCGPSRLYAARVEDGKIILASGTEYHLMVMGQKAGKVTPELAEQIAELVEAGAPLLGNPFTGATGLAGQPQADERVRAAARRIWEAGHKHVFISESPAFILKRMGVLPGFELAGSTESRVFQINREVAGETLYFMVNAEDKPIQFTARFRAQAPVAEIWDPVTGGRICAAGRKLEDGRTELDIKLAERGSAFVVFLHEPTVKPQVETSGFRLVKTLAGPWNVSFPENSGAPAVIQLSELTDLATHSDEGVRFFSGVATYVTEFKWEGDAVNAFFEFDQIEVIAEVELNGEKLGGLWYPPYRIACGQALRKGTNRLTVSVANNWVNRMIGDGHLPDDARYEKDRFPRDPGYNLVEWPGWFLEKRPRPTNRISFPVYKYWTRNDVLQSSGIIGGIRLLICESECNSQQKESVHKNN